ncbi:hemagglutinin repeat-containing protein [Pseudomonas sp. B21-028]|uniref:hemagglutinin repeat-containing protein n=1 Tax=Pseudomonas sp. B21-028 TaxID=2895480 RepID=UPI0038D480EB
MNQVRGLPDRSFQANPQKYLIETNPALTDMRRFMSSDYLLSNLGYDPDDAAKRLGDGFYEQRLIQQAVIARTGQRFLDGQTSDEGMFKYLMNNAIASKDALNLSLGVSLTGEQVAALTHDIVWMETQTVNGQQVLVPVLYLANANHRLAPNGALIQGSDVTLIAGKNLNNAGTLRASNNLVATANDSLVNSGLLEAGNRLDALASNDLTNRAGGVIVGRDVGVVALAGDVTNERTVTRHASGTGYKTEQRDFVDSAARIEASHDLSVGTGRDLKNVGGVLKSGNDSTLRAARDLKITAAEQSSSHTHGAKHRDSNITQYGSSVSVGRDLQATAGADLKTAASEIDVKRNVAMVATNNLTLGVAANEQHSFGQSKKVKSIEDHVQQVSTTLNAGGDVTLSAGQDLALVASTVSAGNEAYLVAGKNLALKTAEDQDYSFYSKTKKTSTSKKFRLDETQSTTNVGSLVSSGGNNTLVAGENLLLAGSAVTAEKGAAKLVAGNDVQVLAATDSDSARHERKQSKSSWGGFKSSKIQDKVDEKRTTAVGSMVSGETVTVAGGQDVKVTGSSLVSTGDLSVQAGRDLTIDAARSTFSRTDMHKEKNRDLTGVLTGNKLGLDDMTGNQHLFINRQKHNGTADETTLTGSTVGSSEGSIDLSAGRDLSVVASDLVSTKNTTLSGSNVTLAAGMETASQRTTDKSSSLAVGRVVGGMIVDTVKSIRDNAKAARKADDGRLKAVKGAQALMALNGMGDRVDDLSAAASGSPNSSGAVFKIGTELANTHSKSSTRYDSTTAKQTTVNSGGNLLIVASGQAAGTAGNIHVIGSKLKAADTLLLAKNDITFESAQNTEDRENHSSNNKTAIGASFNIGSQNGFTLDLGAQLAKGKGSGHDVTQVNSTLDTGSLKLQSGNDTTLAGAQIHADSILALVGGDLNITSRQDTSEHKNKQTSGGFGASICVPPFCYGETVTATANIAASNMNSKYEAVTDQSGLFAGKDGYNITVGKNTVLQGAVIASEATADKNSLSTDRLIVSDIKNVSEIKSQSAGFNASYGSGYGDLKPGTTFGGSVPLSLKDSDHSTTRSAVSEGTITVRNAAGVNDLVGLSRDTDNANSRLDRPDEKAMEERIELIQSTVALSKTVISEVASAQQQAASERARTASTEQERNAAIADAKSWDVGGDKRFMADIAAGLIAAGLGGVGGSTALGVVANTTAADTYKKIGDYADQQLAEATRQKDKTLQTAWGEGGAARVLLHSLAGAAQGLSSGTAAGGALSAGTSAAIMPALDKVLKDSGVGVDSRDAFDVLLAAGLGAAVGKGGIAQASGATIASNVERYNRQVHPTEARLIEQEAPVLAARLGISQAEAEQRMARAFAFYIGEDWNKTIGGTDNQFDAVTLEYLGKALAPLAGRYDTTVGALENDNKGYTSSETLALIKNYNKTHSSEFKNADINIAYLGDPDSYGTTDLVNFYKLNLDFSDRKNGAFDGAKGSLAGLGTSLWSTVQSMASMGNDLLTGHVLEVANNALDPFIEPQDFVGGWMVNQDGQDFVLKLQNNSYGQALRTTKNTLDLATLMIPGPGEVGAVGKVAEVGQFEAKLAQQLEIFNTLGAEGKIPKTEKYFRVEGGGAGNATSQYRITANADGSISINPGCVGQLCVSVGNADHANYYLTNRRQDGSVVVFDVDANLHREIMANAIPQEPIPGIPRDPSAPKIVDPSKPGTALELPKMWESLLEKNSSNARVYSQEAFLKEFGK